MRDGQPGVPSVAGYLAEHLSRGGTLGFDGRTVSAAFARGLEKVLAPHGIRFAADRDLVGEIWADRPALSAEPVWELDAALAGLTREEKLALLRRDMAAQDADTLLLTALDEIAWTLNLRGGDVACTPVFLSFLLIGRERAVLCVQRQILSPEIERALAACGVELAPYADIYDRIAHLQRQQPHHPQRPPRRDAPRPAQSGHPAQSRQDRGRAGKHPRRPRQGRRRRLPRPVRAQDLRRL